MRRRDKYLVMTEGKGNNSADQAKGDGASGDVRQEANEEDGGLARNERTRRGKKVVY